MTLTANMAGRFTAFRRTHSPAIESRLQQLLPDADCASPRLGEAMRYSVLNGGKRIRPLLALCACQSLGAPALQALTAGCAVELLHCYSLVHDDLPAMDDDDLRRGKPTCHIAFDEATAILAGDALQTSAFEALTLATEYSPDQRLKMLAELARASGSEGMVGGQMIDLRAIGARPDLTELKRMHGLKTGALIEASIMLGAYAAGELSSGMVSTLRNFAGALGLAFQIRDDIIDIQSDTSTLGKTAGKDQADEKPTYTTLLGIDGAKGHLERITHEARELLDQLGGADSPLADLLTFVVERNH